MFHELNLYVYILTKNSFGLLILKLLSREMEKESFKCPSK